MKQAAVSIIIPTYNHAHFLSKAIDSVLSQCYGNWELIIVNNFSSDNTQDLVQSYRDSRIKLVNFQNHGVIGASRNYGISLSKAPVIAFLDSDDFWYPRKLAVGMHLLEQGYDLVCHSEIWAGPGSKRRTVNYGPVKRASFKSLFLDGNCISTSAVMVKRAWLDKVGGFSERRDFLTAEDYELWLRLAKEGARFGFVNEVLGEYSIHISNNSLSSLKNARAEMAVYDHYKSILGFRVTKLQLRRREALILYNGARTLQKSGKFLSAFLYYCRAILCYPLATRFYIAMIFNLFGLKM